MLSCRYAGMTALRGPGHKACRCASFPGVLVAVVGVKGGSGKSTTAAYLAEALGAMGFAVALADADPQGTLVEWEAMAEEMGQPFSVEVHPVPSVPMVRRVLPGVATAHEVVVADCPNRDVGVTEAVLAQAGFAVVPAPPGAEELRRATAAMALAEKAGVPARVLVTMVDRRSGLARQMAEALDEGGWPRFASHVRRLTKVAAAVGTRRPDDLADYRYVAEELVALAGFGARPTGEALGA